MHFLGIYSRELWERLNFVEAVKRRGMPFLIMQIHKKKILMIIILEMDNNNPTGSCNTLL